MDAEVRFHIEEFAEDLIRTGVPREEALRKARIEFGGVERVKEECREARSFKLIEDLLYDLCFAVRMLSKNPGFASIAVLTLALGIGANTAIFTMMNGLMLRTLPVRDPRQLVELLQHYPGEPEPGCNSFSLDACRIMRDGNHVFSDLFVGSTMNFAPVRGDKLEPQTLFVGAVRGDFLPSARCATSNRLLNRPR
jgi:hypothetical protein